MSSREAAERENIGGSPVGELPDPFLMLDGRRVRTLSDWKQRREELKTLLQRYEYGRMPPPPGNVTPGEVEACTGPGVDATQRRLTLAMGEGLRLTIPLTITTPRGAGPFPVVVINRLALSRSALLPEKLDLVVRRGYMVAEYNCSDLQADETAELGPAKTAYPNYDWGTLAVWAWGGMRVIDHLFDLPDVDKAKIVVTGHSRGGKTALLTGAFDERVALTVPNAGGGGGFQCWRFPIWPTDVPGVNRHESVEVMSRLRTYWLHPGLKPYVGRVNELPVDQHFLAALVAPRSLCAVEAMADNCATPVCAQRTFLAGRVVYEWLGAHDRLGIHFRQSGGHKQGFEDWAALLDFADLTLFGKRTAGGRVFDALPYPDAAPAFSWAAPAANGR